MIASLDWATYARTAPAVAGVTDQESAARFSEMILKSSSKEFYAAVLSATATPRTDTSPVRSEPLETPMLVVHHRGSTTPEGIVRDFVADQPKAQLILHEGAASIAWAGDIERLASEIETFVAGAGVPGAVVAAEPSPIRTILFTDIQDHTAMMQRLGDAKGREVLREHERITREALRAHGGTEVKTIGDSFMASFPSAQKAVECAIALQRAFAAHSSGVGAQHAAPLPGPVEPIRVRIGLNAGEPIADEDDLFGSSVILAARTKEMAAGGEILVTEVVRHLVTGKGFSFADRGAIEMKGFEEPVRLCEVLWNQPEPPS